MAAWFGSWFGSSGGSCDYPAVTDVRVGTVYAIGTRVGVLSSPNQLDVRYGIGYGAYGTEFVGALFTGPQGGGDSLMLHSPAQILARLIVLLGEATDPTPWEAGSGPDWPVFASDEPARPDDCLTVFDTTPKSDGRAMVTGQQFYHYGVQVLVRAADHPTGWAKAEALKVALNERVQAAVVTIESTDYLIHSISGAMLLTLGKETPTSKRRHYSINATMSVRALP